MTADLQHWQQETEMQFIESLRARYEDEGFAFTAYPEPAQLPHFLGTFSPDALAQKPGRNVVIEVKRRQSPSADRAPRDIRRLIDGHADWHLHVIFMGTDPLQLMTIPTVAPDLIRARTHEVRALVAQGHHGPALIVAWSLLEAAFRAMNGEVASHTNTPATIVQTLAMNGQIEPEVEQRVRALIELRNRIVHGDLKAEPTAADVEALLSAVEETLSADAS